jgi:hypothetical protein
MPELIACPDPACTAPATIIPTLDALAAQPARPPLVTTVHLVGRVR